MGARVDKYYDKDMVVGSRTERNSTLYKDISKSELENFEIRSNATVIGNSKNNIDVEKIKSILDTHYKDIPRRQSIRLEDQEEKEEIKPILETKEYDINVILDKAKEDKEVDYSEERSKKLRDTQFDILNNLDLNDYIEDYEKEDMPSSASLNKNEDLQRLIDTITLNEKELKKTSVKVPSNNDDLDLFEDLKGSNDTIILDGLKESTKEISNESDNFKTGEIDKSFFTTANNFKDKDFEEFEDLNEKSNIGVKIVVSILIIIFIIGIFVLVKSFL